MGVREGSRGFPGEAGVGGSREGPEVERPVPESFWKRQLRQRVAPVDMLDTLQDISVTEEPEALQTLAGEHDHVDDADRSSADDDDLRWAQSRAQSSDGKLSHTHALLVALLPTSHLSTYPHHQIGPTLLNALSPGQLLCVAYNVCVRLSRKPWEYIKDE